MSSSTSSSSQREWRVVLFLALCLLGAEGVVRLIEPKLSRDLAQIRNLPNVARDLREHQGSKILVMGNSLSRQAINTAMLEQGLKASDRKNPAVFEFFADATSAPNWDYGLAHYFLYQNAVPDELFLGTGPLHLRDIEGDASRLAAYYVDKKDLSRAWAEDAVTWEEKCEFVLSRISVVHASRHRIKPHAFGRTIPNYFDIEQWINTQRDVARQRTGKMPVDNETHHHLTHLLELCRQAGTKVTLFSIPLPQPYQISPKAIETVQTGGASWLELSGIPGLTSENFPDGYHLNSEGSRVFTGALLKALHLPAGEGK